MPEDNKLLVPPFSKKEVKAIAVEGVNEGIADGKIDIPAGGTKLYKHYINILTNSGSYILIGISLSKEQIKAGDSIECPLISSVSPGENQLKSIGKPYPSATFISVSYIGTTEFTVDGTSYTRILQFQDASINIADITKFSDTIEEL